MPDPRHVSPTKIKPPKPLPYVSRKALKRVKDWLPRPTVCNCCGEESVVLSNNRDVYNGKSFGEWPYVYRCVACNAYVGLHPDTDLPLGTLADTMTRDARKAAKQLYFKVNELFFGGDRTATYGWLAKQMGMVQSRCHFAMFTEFEACGAAETCYTAIMDGEIVPPFSLTGEVRRYAI